eukprot:9676187-Heterocapsa_arctica.AAC.1
MGITLATRSGRKHITEWWKTTKTKSSRKYKKLRLTGKGIILRWITIVEIKTWTKCTDMCMK